MNYTDFQTDKGDLVIEPASREWAVVNDPVVAMKEIVMESFEQPFGDDIDYPFLHSRQENLQNSIQDDNLPIAARIADAERILLQHSEIIEDSIDIDVESDLSLSISYNLKDAGSVSGLTI